MVFQQGDFRFDITDGLVCRGRYRGRHHGGAAVFTYRTVGVNGRPRDRVVLTALRMVALALVVFCLFRPTLVVKAAIPQQNVVAVLLDDSRSMQIPDWQRPAARPSSCGSSWPPTPVRCSRRCRTGFSSGVFRFSSTAGAREFGQGSVLHGSQTKLGAALDGVREELAGLPVAGVVLVTDGADTSDASLTHAAGPEGREAAGLHRRRRQREAGARHPDRPGQRAAHGAQGRVAAGRRRDHADRLRGSDRHARRRRRRPHRRLAEGAAARGRQPGDGSRPRHRERAGSRVFRFKVAPQHGEVVTQNNARDSLSTSATCGKRFSTSKASRASR